MVPRRAGRPVGRDMGMVLSMACVGGAMVATWMGIMVVACGAGPLAVGTGSGEAAGVVEEGTKVVVTPAGSGVGPLAGRRTAAEPAGRACRGQGQGSRGVSKSSRMHIYHTLAFNPQLLHTTGNAACHYGPPCGHRHGSARCPRLNSPGRSVALARHR